MSHPPHLPPKSCSVPLYRRLMLSSSLIVITIIALASGLVGGIVSDVYIVPEQYTTGTGVVSRGNTHLVKELEDPIFLRDQLRKTVTLVQKSVYSLEGYLPLDYTLTGVLLTDTGWFVIPQLGELSPAADEWIAVAMNGEVYDVKTFITDARSGVVYGSLQANGFRVTSFADLSSLTPGLSLWALRNGNLERTALAYPEARTGESADTLGNAQYLFHTEATLPFGTVLWTDDGAFFGFVNDAGVLVPWFMIESMYTDVLSGNEITYTPLPVTGNVVLLTEKQSALAAGARYGFFLDTVDASTSLQANDLITHIGDTTIDPWTVQAQIALQNGDTIFLRVLREGERQDVVLNK